MGAARLQGSSQKRAQYRGVWLLSFVEWAVSQSCIIEQNPNWTPRPHNCRAAYPATAQDLSLVFSLRDQWTVFIDSPGITLFRAGEYLAVQVAVVIHEVVLVDSVALGVRAPSADHRLCPIVQHEDGSTFEADHVARKFDRVANHSLRGLARGLGE